MLTRKSCISIFHNPRLKKTEPRNKDRENYGQTDELMHRVIIYIAFVGRGNTNRGKTYEDG